MTRVEITFDETHVEPIKSGDKTLTARYQWDDRLNEGDVIEFLTPDGEQFATGYCVNVVTMTAWDFVASDWDGHREYDDIDELYREFGQYYRHAEIGPKTELTVIRWRGVGDFIRRWEVESP